MISPPQFDNLEILDLLGQGGMATVWKARQLSLDRLVAVKVLSPNLASDPDDIARFREEAQAAGRLTHRGIVQVYDANFLNGKYYLIMELVNGYTVGQWLRRKGSLAIDDVLTTAESVAEAMDYAWRTFRMVHRDIKPDNIMVDADGTVKVTDLGLAKSISAVQTGDARDEIIGTPAYMAPEQVDGRTDLDCRTDIYGLGATLYHLIAGRMLFAGTPEEIMRRQVVGHAPSLRALAPGVPMACELLIEKMLAKKRAMRPRDWREVLRDIRRTRRKHPPAGLLPPAGASTVAHDPETPRVLEGRAPAPPRTAGWLWFVLAAAAVTALALLAGWFLCP